jgi:WAS family protein 1
MDAIRQTGGGAKLRSGKERKLKKKAEKEQAAVASSGGGDLMGDLFAKLSMRRKGISGSKGDSSSGPSSSLGADTGGGSAMDKISAMIPPPPKASRGESMRSHESDDWDS